MPEKNMFEVTDKEIDFYERNIGNAVNLFTERSTFSGDIVRYDSRGRMVVLTNCITQIYNPDGSSQFEESPEKYELDIPMIKSCAKSSKEDRLGRIVKYNLELQIEELEKRAKLRRLLAEEAQAQNHS